LENLFPNSFLSFANAIRKKGGSSLVLLLLLVAGAVFAVYKFGRTDFATENGSAIVRDARVRASGLATPTPESTPV